MAPITIELSAVATDSDSKVRLIKNGFVDIRAPLFFVCEIDFLV